MEQQEILNLQIPESSMVPEERPLPKVITHKMENQSTGLLLEQGNEAIHRVDITWWIEQIRLRIEPSWSSRQGLPIHSLQMASMRLIDQDHRRIRSILTSMDTDPFPPYPDMESFNILFWNCRGVGNNAFKRNMKELVCNHHPGIIILMEPKIPFSSTRNFFNNLGYTAASILDPAGRAGGIWMLWDTEQVNVRASVISNQVIQATIHKEDYEEWVLLAIHASPNPSNREALWDNLEDTTRTMDKPWLVFGDLNDFVSQDERRSFTPNHHNNRCQKFLE
ncbi:hypothetical protein LOK49_LG09G00088 [Camellia lanceoleosa]|uniref:Uncharacterized protein n=1 Tax=Camellia lanceoleosa TaxID=1840588 RepID=A0ACC0GED4_9ERIC|nr:hypothetical protein LOK49_LG09G00088 [Camellia lanceoleosa]